MNYEATYPAKVTTNEDDEQRGRIKVACVGLLGDEETEIPDWIEPIPDWGWFYVPDIGETVEIVAVLSSDDDESPYQTSIMNWDLRWRGSRYFTDEEPENEQTTPTPVHPDFKINYAKRRGFATPYGHTLIFDDSPKTPAVQLTFSKKQLEVGSDVEPSNITRVEIEADGSLKVSVQDKHTLHLQSDGNKFIISIDNGESMELAGKNGDATLKIGDGAVGVAIAPALETYINNSVKLYLDAHIHPDAMGGTGVPSTQMPEYDSSITSTKVTIPDG